MEKDPKITSMSPDTSNINYYYYYYYKCWARNLFHRE